MTKVTWKVEVTLEVADSWVMDGFDASNRIDEIEEKLSHLLPHAYGNEFKVSAKITKKPTKKLLRELEDEWIRQENE